MNQLPQLVKKSSTYKLIIPEHVEEKIRYLLRKFPSTEWSGVLFTSHIGSFENNDLEITCQDIYPMDLGNATFTQFQMSEDVASYMADNIELFDCDIELVHSHHQMSTSPSNTDLSTLRTEGNDRNCFVSLIVNNAGTYYAAVTRKVTSKSQIIIENLGSSYEFFGEGKVNIPIDTPQETETAENTVIEYFDLDIVRHTVSNPLEYLDTRFAEILKKKESEVKHTTPLTSLVDTNFHDWLHKDYPTKSEPYLFDDTTMKSLEYSKASYNISSGQFNFIPNQKLIHKAIVRMILCSFILNPDKVDLKQWIKVHMKKKYEEIFHINSSNNLDEFNEWRDFIVTYTLDHYEELFQVDYNHWEDATYAIIEAMLGELEEFRGTNPYIDSYITTLEQNMW